MAKKKKNLYPKAPKKTGIRAWLRRRKLRTRRSLAADIMLMLFLGVFGIFSLFPLIYTVVSAFKPMSETTPPWITSSTCPSSWKALTFPSPATCSTRW